MKAHIIDFNFSNTTIDKVKVSLFYNSTKANTAARVLQDRRGSNCAALIQTIENTSDTDRIYTYFDINNAAVFEHTTSEYCSFYYAIFNLTKMFGAGNEPSTIEEFERLFPESYYAYGHLIAPSIYSRNRYLLIYNIKESF